MGMEGSIRIEKLLPEIMKELEKDPNIIAKAGEDKDTILRFMLMHMARVLDMEHREQIRDGLSHAPGLKKLYAFYNQAETIMNLVHAFSKDTAMLSCATTVNRYLKGGKNYVIDREFFKYFRRINLEKVQIIHLPKNISGYVKLPEPLFDVDGEKIIEFFFVIDHESQINLGNTHIHPFKDSSADCLLLGWLTDTRSMGYANYPLPKDTNVFLKDYFKTVPYRERSPEHGTRITDGDGFANHIATMLNILAYINSGDPDLRLFRNTFRYRGNSTTKVIRADKGLATQDINLIGFNWKKSPLYVTEGWYASPYWATRYPDNVPTITFCSGSFRKRKDLIT